MLAFLEDLDYQRRAIDTATDIFEGQVKNSFDNANFFGIQANVTDLTPEMIEANKRKILVRNGIAVEDAQLGPENDISLDLEIAPETVDYFDAHRDCFFICLERALDTAKKWNLKLHLADKLKTV